MAKKDKNVSMETTEQQAAPQQQVPQQTDPRMITDEKLQSYYAEAYINERERLNAMFGRLDTYPTNAVQEKIIYRDPDPAEYVPMAEYKKMRKKKNLFLGLTIAFGAIAVAAIVALVVIVLK